MCGVGTSQIGSWAEMGQSDGPWPGYGHTMLAALNGKRAIYQSDPLINGIIRLVVTHKS